MTFLLRRPSGARSGRRRADSRARDVGSAVRIGAVGLLSVAAFSAATPSTGVAANGITITSETTYNIDPIAGVVEVSIHSTFANTVADRTEGGYIKQTYFEGAAVIVPRGVADVVVRTGDTDLAVEREPLDRDSAFDLVSFTFAEKLYYNEDTTVDVAYTLDGAAPRDRANPSRINEAFASFSTWATGDPGRTTLTVVVPNGFEVDASSTLAGAEFTDVDDSRVYTFDGSDVDVLDDGSDAGNLFAFVAVGNPDNLLRADVAVGDTTFRVRAWPDDPDWATFTADVVRRGVPFLERQLGSEWPSGGGADIRESMIPYINGYSGWFDRQGDIEIGEELDDNVILHELSHAWLDGEWSDERWMIEGFAQHVAQLGSSQLFDNRVDPPTDPHTGDTAVGDLLNWTTDTAFVDQDEAEDAGYNASWFVTDSIFEVIGSGELPRVVEAVGNPDPDDDLAPWQLLINATEPIIGDDPTASSEVSRLIAEYVTTPTGDAQIDERTTAADARATLVNAAGEWGVPIAIDDALDRWRCAEAVEQIGWARAAIDARDDLLQAANTTSLTVGTATLRAAFAAAETEVDYEAVVADAAELRRAANHVRAARSSVADADGMLSRIGSWPSDSPDDAIDAATAALAAGDATTADNAASTAETLAARAPGAGRRRVIIAAVCLLGLIASAIIAVAVWRRRADRAESTIGRRIVPIPPGYGPGAADNRGDDPDLTARATPPPSRAESIAPLADDDGHRDDR